MKAHPRNRDQKLYIKADARAPYTNVEYALKAAHSAEFAAPILLTAQPPASGNLLPPSGLEVLVGPAPAGSVATVVELFNSGQQPVLKINDEQIPWPALQSTLTRHFQKGDERVVLVKADGRLPFADVARVIDSCRSAGAKVVLPGPSL
jgi:biopolymer transport protein ExbD